MDRKELRATVTGASTSRLCFLSTALLFSVMAGFLVHSRTVDERHREISRIVVRWKVNFQAKTAVINLRGDEALFYLSTRSCLSEFKRGQRRGELRGKKYIAFKSMLDEISWSCLNTGTRSHHIIGSFPYQITITRGSINTDLEAPNDSREIHSLLNVLGSVGAPTCIPYARVGAD